MTDNAAETWVASRQAWRADSKYRREEAPEGSGRLCVLFETDESHIVDGPVVSASQAACKLGISRAITRMIDAVLLKGYRSGRGKPAAYLNQNHPYAQLCNCLFNPSSNSIESFWQHNRDTLFLFG